jgi:hypothetical protein
MVVIDEHLSDEMINLMRGQPDCIIYPYLEDPKLFCKKCFCCKCEKVATDCPLWEKHCLVTKVDCNEKVEEKQEQKLKGSEEE